MKGNETPWSRRSPRPPRRHCEARSAEAIHPALRTRRMDCFAFGSQ